MYSSVAKNKRNTIIMFLLFAILMSALCYVLWFLTKDYSTVVSIAVFAIAYMIFQYFLAGNIALAVNGAKEIQKKDAPELWNAIENTAITDGLPMPKVYIMNDSSPNAFATGRDPEHAAIAVTTGLLKIMDKRELTAVIGHEMGHIKNYDIRVSMIAFGLASVVTIIGDVAFRIAFYGGRSRNKDSGQVTAIAALVGVLFGIIGALLATILKFAISRQREYLADATSVQTTRDTDGMVSALEKLKNYGKPMKRQNAATEGMFINNPLKKDFMSRIFSTHPPLDDRITRLKNNSAKM